MDQKTRKLMTLHSVLHLSDDIHYMCQEEKEEVVSLALRVDLMLKYKDSRTTLKGEKKETNYSCLKQQWKPKVKQKDNKNWKTEMGRKATTDDKLWRLHTKRPGHV